MSNSDDTCPSLLDTLGFLKFPDDEPINFTVTSPSTELSNADTKTTATTSNQVSSQSDTTRTNSNSKATVSNPEVSSDTTSTNSNSEANPKVSSDTNNTTSDDSNTTSTESSSESSDKKSTLQASIQTGKGRESDRVSKKRVYYYRHKV